MKPFTFFLTAVSSFLAGYAAGLFSEQISDAFEKTKDFCKAAKELAEKQNTASGTPTPPAVPPAGSP